MAHIRGRCHYPLRSFLQSWWLIPARTTPRHNNDQRGLTEYQRSQDRTKQTTFIHWLKCLKADIVCLQEMHATSHATFRSWFSNSGYVVASSCISNKRAGTAILVSSKHCLDKVWQDDAGRFVQAEVGIGKQVLPFVSLYTPNINPARNKFFASRPDLMDMCHPIFVCQDFNSVLDPDLDQRHP